MKRFYSELAANPAHYSFGYSAYGELEEGDDLAALYAEGFLPFVGGEDVSRMMYMARSARVAAKEFRENTYHARVRRKVHDAGLTHASYAWHAYPRQEEALRVISEYFRFRHGREAMPRARLEKILSFDPCVMIVEYVSAGSVAGYSIEVPLREGAHQWYYAYTAAWEGRHLGAYIMLDFISRTKDGDGAYAYVGVTYGSSMLYKTNFQPIEYWNGRGWVRDAASLKKLLKTDALRVVVVTDEWRDTIHPFYPAPTGFGSGLGELKFLYLILTATPRVAIFMCLWFAIMALAVAAALFP